MNQSTADKVITVSLREAGRRLDVFCVSQIRGFSRSALQRAIKKGEITVNGGSVKPRYALREGDEVRIAVSGRVIARGEQVTSPASPRAAFGRSGDKGGLREVNIPILYEDKSVVVINKPAGVVVHRGVGTGPTVSGWFVARYPDARDAGDPNRPGIVHRLDKDTSGVMILAKTQEAFEYLKKKFKKRKARKEYLALVFGVPGEKKGRVTRALSRSKRNPLRRMIDLMGRPAVTEWKKEEVFGNRYALLRVFPYTGRMHQIRVHLHFLGFPIVGDQLYTFKHQRPPQGVTCHMLHAEKLTIELPDGKRRIFTAPLPQDFSSVLTLLRRGFLADRGR